MTVNTRQVAQRRELRFESFDDLLSDAERLAAGQATTSGNWTLGQIFQHLAKTMDSSIDGTEMKIPWVMKMILRLIFNKEKLLNEPIRPGFKIPKQGQAQFGPDADISTEEGLALLRAAIDRLRNDSTREPHPALGDLTAEEWEKMHLRHAELHMSFADLTIQN